MNTILVPNAVMLDMLKMSEFQNPLTGLNFQGTDNGLSQPYDLFEHVLSPPLVSHLRRIRWSESSLRRCTAWRTRRCW